MREFIAYFTFFFDMAALTVLLFLAIEEHKERKEQKLAEYERKKNMPAYREIKEVHALLIDNNGFLATYQTPVESPHHVFCERMKSFCNSNCQFFATSITDNDIARGKPRFDCWMMPVCYQAKEMHDWRNTDSCKGPKSVR